jgi:GNAT superfamily N-acetyltransferase
MAIDLALLEDEPAVPGLEITEAVSAAEMNDFAAVVAAGFRLPEFVADFLCRAMDQVRTLDSVHYLGSLDGRPVATSSLMFGAGVAGIYNVATLEAARGRGIGRAITRAPLLEGRRRGYRAGILQASALGRPVYERLGFRIYCTIDEYVWTPPDSLKD